MLVLLANNFTNYTAVDYARKEERVIRPSVVRVRDPWVVVFPLRRVLAMLMTAARSTVK